MTRFGSTQMGILDWLRGRFSKNSPSNAPEPIAKHSASSTSIESGPTALPASTETPEPPAETETPEPQAESGNADYFPRTVGPSAIETEVELSARNLIRIVHESISIAKRTKNEDTRRSRLNVAKQRLHDLRDLADRFPFLQVENADAVERDIDALREAFGLAAPGQPITKNAEEFFDASADLIKHYRFLAFLSYDTPLSVLRRHGEISATRPTEEVPPRHGMWSPEFRSYREIGLPGLDSVAEAPGFMASDFGPVPKDGGPWLTWLIAVRQVIEGCSDPTEVERRITELRESDPYEEIRESIPRDVGLTLAMEPIRSIDGVSEAIAQELWAKGYRTRDRLRAATDADLRAIRGIGPAKLAKIRNALGSHARADDLTSRSR